ncbi:putative reverse transcriptase domain-containing protein [Tanacetum coccineum]
MILAAQSEAFKQENVLAERLHGLDQQMERKGYESLYFMDQIWVLLVGSVMDEAHASRYLVHPGADKTYHNLGDMYWYPRVENDIATYVSNYNSKEWNSSDDQLRLRWMIYLMVLADDVDSILEDTMRACVIDFGGSYHLSIRCSPFEALYRRKCRSPVLWAEIGEGIVIGPELVLETTDKVVLIKEKLKATRDRQKSYVDKRRKPLELVGDRVLLKVWPWKGIVHFGKKAYRLRLPEELNSVHDTFHVSNLKKCLTDANLHVPLNEIKVEKTLHFVKQPVEIMDREIKKLKHRKITLLKVRWNSKYGPEFTWEHEDHMRIKYP